MVTGINLDAGRTGITKHSLRPVLTIHQLSDGYSRLDFPDPGRPNKQVGVSQPFFFV